LNNETNPLVDVRYFSLPGNEPNGRLLRHIFLRTRYVVSMAMVSCQFYTQNGKKRFCQEHVVNHDCFYRSRAAYEYVALLDVDEVLFPTRSPNYARLISLPIIESVAIISIVWLPDIDPSGKNATTCSSEWLSF